MERRPPGFLALLAARKAKPDQDDASEPRTQRGEDARDCYLESPTGTGSARPAHSRKQREPRK